MKKIGKIGFILLSIVWIASSVYAASCSMNLQTVKNEFDKNEEFVVDVNVSNIQTEKGIIALGATLEYDKNSLTLQGMSGQNSWANPSYNEANGKLIMDRGSATSSNETILKITFKVKENATGNATITLKNISVSDGVEEIVVPNITKNITVKTETTTPNTPAAPVTPTVPSTPNTPSQPIAPSNKNHSDGNAGTTNNNTNTNGSASNQSNASATSGTSTNGNKNIVASTSNDNKKDSARKGSLPKTGTAFNVTLILISIALAFVAIFYIKMKVIDRKMSGK